MYTLNNMGFSIIRRMLEKTRMQSNGVLQIPTRRQIFAWQTEFVPEEAMLQSLDTHLDTLASSRDSIQRIHAITKYYRFLQEHPGFLTHFSLFRRTSLQQIPIIIQSLYTPVFRRVSNTHKNVLRNTLSSYLSLIFYIQSCILENMQQVITPDDAIIHIKVEE